MGLEGSAGGIRRRGGEGAEGTGKRGEGGGECGKSPALSMFIMLHDAAMLWYHWGPSSHILPPPRRRRRRIHLKMRFGPLPLQSLQNRGYYNANKMFCLGDTSLMFSQFFLSRSEASIKIFI